MGAPASNRDWPEPKDYDDALLRRAETCSDPEIRQGALKEHKPGWPLPLNGGGSPYVRVYEVGQQVIRCFTYEPPRKAPPADIVRRYEKIIAHQRESVRKGSQLPFLVPHTWVEPGLKIKGVDYPFLKLPFVEQTRKLGDFLRDERRSKATIRILKEQWLLMIRQLEQNQVAHGDLDLSNVLVKGTYPDLSLHLIDFDGMYVPELESCVREGMGMAESGHTNFQYPSRTFGPAMDRFSALVIYITLCALEGKTDLWEACHATEAQSLLGTRDFQRLSDSTSFPLLLQERQNRPLQECLAALEESIKNKALPPALDTILHISSVSVPYAIQQPPEKTVPGRWPGRNLPLPIEDGEESFAQQPGITHQLPAPDQPSVPLSQPPAFPYPPTVPLSPPAEPRKVASQSVNVAVVIAIIIAIIIVAAIVFALFRASQSPSSSSMIYIVSFLRIFSNEYTEK